MPFSDYPPTGPFTPRSRAEDLLTSRDHFGEFWQTEFGSYKVFYVRGTTEFKETVVKEASRVYANIREMQKLVVLMQNWGAPRWPAEFSRNQVSEAWSKQPLAFDKAAKTIVLCGVTAEIERQGNEHIPTGAAVYSKMRIEPAVYFIHGFDMACFNQIRQWDEAFFQSLKEATGQKNTTVFADMANGDSVTLRLAKAVQSRLREVFPALDIGDLDIPSHRRFSASSHETVDLR